MSESKSLEQDEEEAQGLFNHATSSSQGVGDVSPSVPAAICWNPLTVVQAISLFFIAGLAEIGGGWLVWQCIREKKPWYYFLAGALVLVCYGIIPTLQPDGAGFARVYAVYGGVFIVMSYAWGWLVDHERPDMPDVVGSCIAIVGVGVCWFYPRKGGTELPSHP